MRTRNSGFTLIELLIVVAIIAILAAIAVPNFLESQTRAKITRAKSDLRSVTVAVEAFHVDNAQYPQCDPAFNGDVGLAAVTTPIAYIVGNNVRDIFFKEDAVGNLSTSYGYASRDFEEWAVRGSLVKGRWYFVTSNGPNLKVDDYRTTVDSDNFEAFLATIYDPTNGTVSNGNVYRAGGTINGNGERHGRFVSNFAPSSVNGG